MAIPNGKPATDFSAMNREYIRAVAKEEAAAGGGIPAPASPSNGDVLTYDSTSEKWIGAKKEAILFVMITEDSGTYTADKTATEIINALRENKDVIFHSGGNVPNGTYLHVSKVTALYITATGFESISNFTTFNAIEVQMKRSDNTVTRSVKNMLST